MNNGISRITIMALVVFFPGSCKNRISGNGEMTDLLSSVAKSEYDPGNTFCEEAKLDLYNSAYNGSSNFLDSANAEYSIALTLLEAGKELQSIVLFENLLKKVQTWDIARSLKVMKQLAIANVRLGERMNCVNDHSGGSCIFPITGRGVHVDKVGSEKAIELYGRIIKTDPSDLESRWLLNIAYMTIGGYPQKVPANFLIKGLDSDNSSGVKPFIDVAVKIGLNTKNLAGGSIADDFNNDGYLDIVTSSWRLGEGMHYCRNNSNGSFTDIPDSSGLKYLTGGLNMMQTDYNNDGLKDIFVLRGGWKGEFGREPNSLLRNNGDGTFTDVTKQSGLLSFYPTQTATWNDFNNDGWLDVFIGNETTSDCTSPRELYINNKNGTFTEVAANAGCKVVAFVKGVTSGDYDNDGLPDIFISTLDGDKILLKNEGIQNGNIHFKDETRQAGLGNNKTRTFPTWFWDYDNDGWLDILVCGYDFNRSLAWYAAAEALGQPVGNSGKVFLLRNNHDGTFEDVSEKAALNKVAFAMGANIGDIDNDGYLDMYLGTGNPLYQSLVPNKMFKNIVGRRFIDVTTSARVGNLQKGHGVSFADLDNDGDEDICIDMGGAYAGDAYQNSLYINPGQNNNHWINISLEGTTCNRAAIGAKIKVSFLENGVVRSVYRDVNSGGSFGSNPLAQHIGIGQATTVQSVEIKWPVSHAVQVFENIQPGEYLKLKEGNNSFSKLQLSKADFTVRKPGVIYCTP
ncbi:MAG: CRTAC1 family protein [Ferruginibacter sp.]